MLNPLKLSFKTEGEIKTFLDKQIMSTCVASQPFLQQRLEEILHAERNYSEWKLEYT
jgi:hypothetical protein